MRRYLAAMFVLLMAAPAVAQPPYYARGTFGTTTPEQPDPWMDLTHQMLDEGGGHYTATVGDSLTYFPNIALDYKLANSDYSTQSPLTNGHVVTDANGEVNFHLWTNNGDPWTDGWSPKAGPRAGYDDPLQFGWEVVGSFNGWPGTADPAFALTDMGSGLYHGQFTLNAGSYKFKYRQQGSWDTRIGSDFGNDSADIPFRVWNNGDLWKFDLDLPNGRWRAYTDVPSPDVNGDDYVDAADFVMWRKEGGTQPVYDAWRAHFGAAPPAPPPGWYARGSFGNPANGGGDAWNDLTNQMEDQGSGYYTKTISGLTPGTNYEYKIARTDWSQQAPTSNGQVSADASGAITFHFWEATSWTDGWEPDTTRRVGFVDPGLYGWELMGDFPGNGWGGGAAWHLTSEGEGVYRVEATLAQITTSTGYQFKFRKTDDWSISLGAGFGSDNATTGPLAAGTYAFELDLPNGRWKISPVVVGASDLGAVPEPSSAVLLVLGAMIALGAGHRRS